MNLVTRHLTTLTDFSGRENREPFWLWVLAVYVGQMVVGMVVMLPMQFMLQMRMAPQFEALQKQQEAGQQPDPQQMFAMMAPLFTFIMIFSVVIGLLFLALLAAALVRRLHDSGRSGYWALPQLLLAIVGQGAMVWFFTNFASFFAHPEALKDTLPVFMAWFMVVWLIGFALMIVLLVLLVLPGTDGPNRYGDDPLAEYRAREHERRAAAYAAYGATPNPQAPPRRPATVVRREPEP
ncbi:DUF805 domain-containing protein [Sphingomonas immobilis]|uniref:DUF805 domain-containing protein n=1 Tax=Sphingomonas immobilis TaxID=3063997 RepID=A0ABT9A4U4_9SPHN|nr:DUF805 domain-containing protein [Sphingomonas sp. CA1-15]MDO7844369.1 DUF805 domain-containing protein [Sphingomonas sp. CA1-15]